jgi:transcriptional repressor NrdR
MICIKCGHNNTSVTNSRQNKKNSTVWRRRQCKDCKCVFTTYEEVAIDQIEVLSGTRANPFYHAKLLISIANCFEHIPTRRAENAEAIAKTVEAKLIQSGIKTTPQAICEAVYASLKHFDKLASVQYAARHPNNLKKHLRL